MAKTIQKNLQYKSYIIINGQQNSSNQLIVNLPSYVYGFLVIKQNQAVLSQDNKQYDYAKAELITLHDMLKLIKGKQLLTDKYWQDIMPSIKLFANNDTQGVKQLKHTNVLTNSEELSI